MCVSVCMGCVEVCVCTCRDVCVCLCVEGQSRVNQEAASGRCHGFPCL